MTNFKKTESSIERDGIDESKISYSKYFFLIIVRKFNKLL